MAEKKIEMTQAGLEKLEKEYRHLLEIDRPEVIEALKMARSQGDLSENADYDAARNRQAEIEARIAEIEHIRDIAVIKDTKGKTKKINIGYVVEYKEVVTGDANKIKLVGTVEADPMAEPMPLVSNESALGMALIGHEAGETVMVESMKPYEVEILAAYVD